MVGLVYSGCQDPPIARCENLEDKCRKCLHSPGRNYHNSSYVDVYIVCGGSAAKTFLNPCLAGCPKKDIYSIPKKQSYCGYTEYHLSNCTYMCLRAYRRLLCHEGKVQDEEVREVLQVLRVRAYHLPLLPDLGPTGRLSLPDALEDRV